MSAMVGSRVVADPPLARFLFADTRLAPLWLVVRLYVGYAWFDAGWDKIMDTGAKTNYIIDGSGILAFWQRIAAVPAAPAKPVITYDWYRNFIQLMIDNHWEGVFGKLIAFGETTVGIALILGAFTGLAAVTGAFMNLNFMLAGSASTNPVLLLLGFLLVLAWKTAGYIGLDRWLLPLLGSHGSEGRRRVVPPRDSAEGARRRRPRELARRSPRRTRDRLATPHRAQPPSRTARE